MSSITSPSVKDHILTITSTAKEALKKVEVYAEIAIKLANQFKEMLALAEKEIEVIESAFDEAEKIKLKRCQFLLEHQELLASDEEYEKITEIDSIIIDLYQQILLAKGYFKEATSTIKKIL